MSELKDASFDVIIVGGGAAGLAAAIYTSRRALRTLVISKDIGGQAALTDEIENYPGRGLVDGFVLMQDFKKQAEEFGAIIQSGDVLAVEPDPEEGFFVRTTLETFRCHAVILAFGLTPKDLGVPGEAPLKGRGVSYCATCDAPFFKEKRVAVVGGGTHALDAAEYLSRLANSVVVFNEQEQFVGTTQVIQSVQSATNVQVRHKTRVLQILGNERVTGVIVESEGKTETFPLDGIFVELGYTAKTDWVAHVVELDERRQIKIDLDCKTSRPGVFAAGDVTVIHYKQVIISAGEGAKAALTAYKYLQEKGLIKRGANVDWGIAKTKKETPGE
jgi:thioredoxin reductase (NADPH)